MFTILIDAAVCSVVEINSHYKAYTVGPVKVLIYSFKRLQPNY